MNKKQQTIFNDILDELIYTSNELEKIKEQISNIKEILNIDDSEIPQVLIYKRHYCEVKIHKLKQELNSLVNAPTSNIKKFMIGLGWFWSIFLSVLAAVTGNILMAGVAAIFPFLIYPVGSEK